MKKVLSVAMLVLFATGAYAQCYGPIVAGVCHDANHTPQGFPRSYAPPELPGQLPGGQCAGPVINGVCHDAVHNPPTSQPNPYSHRFPRRGCGLFGLKVCSKKHQKKQ